MKRSDLKDIKHKYEVFNNLLFAGVLPDASKINFILHNIQGAAGYSKFSKTPTKNGNQHTIAFAEYLKFSDKQITEILIHEMIHLWQVYSVKQERYEICTHAIAHDRVFLSKMTTINLLLKRLMYDLQISDIFRDKLEYDEDIKAKTEFKVIFAKFVNGQCGLLKVRNKQFDDVLNRVKEDANNIGVEDFYYISSSDVIFTKFPFYSKNRFYFICNAETNELYTKYLNIAQ